MGSSLSGRARRYSCRQDPNGTKQNTGASRRFLYLDSKELEGKPAPDMAMVQTVHRIMEGFTKCEVERDTLAGRAHAMIGCPTDAEFTSIVSSGSVKNCPVTPVDVANKRVIFGPD